MTFTVQPTIAELFDRLTRLETEKDDIAAALAVKNEQIAALRDVIREGLTQQGATSHTDAATGWSARIETRTAWRVADVAALTAAVDGEPFLAVELYEQQINTKRVIELAKQGRVLPGVEQQVTETFVVRRGKTS
jgi:hypothetical protein